MINQAHIHLLLNHLPVAGTVVGVLILLGGFLLKQPIIKQTALGVFILSALFAIPSYLTGEGAEEVIENIAGVGESFIESHEDLASIYLWCIGVLGVGSLLTFFSVQRGMKAANRLYWFVLLLSLIAVGVSFRLGVTGGEIRHTEIRKDGVTLIQPGGVAPVQDDD